MVPGQPGPLHSGRFQLCGCVCGCGAEPRGAGDVPGGGEGHWHPKGTRGRWGWVLGVAGGGWWVDGGGWLDDGVDMEGMANPGLMMFFFFKNG